METLKRDSSLRNVINSQQLRSPLTPAHPTQPVKAHRIYRAPQASTIRNDRKISHKAGSTRRRRRENIPMYEVAAAGEPSLEAPYLWNDVDELGLSNSDRGSQQRRRGTLNLRQGFEEFSDSFYGDYDDSNHGTFYQNEYYAVSMKKGGGLGFLRGILNFQTLLQFILLMVFGFMIYDSHTRVLKHKVQLAQYDEERAHILEQMMWIDRAAKRVHKKYAQKEIWDGLVDERINQETKMELVDEARGLRDAIKKLQLRIQLNARSQIEERFGQRPAQVSLALDKEGKDFLVIGLTDDTPHAASILLEQIDRKVWDKIELQRLDSGVIQVSTDLPATYPVLEFVESSHTCHEVGSVVFRQLEAESLDLNVAVLRIHMLENTPISAEDVCIGKVKNGLDYLKDLERIPYIMEN